MTNDTFPLDSAKHFKSWMDNQDWMYKSDAVSLQAHEVYSALRRVEFCGCWALAPIDVLSHAAKLREMLRVAPAGNA